MGKSVDLPQTKIVSLSVPVGAHINHLAVGTAQGFVASAICLPTGILTAAFLTRQLGPVDYGLLTVAATIVVWIETTITMGFSRTVVKFVAETAGWQSASTRFLQAQLLVSLLATVLLAVAAPILASWLRASEMSTYLRIYALGIPITALGAIHQSILIGRGHFGRRAVLPAAYWLSRMVLVFLFVGLRPSVTNAILANIGAAVVVLTCARRFVSPALLKHSDFPFRNLWDYAWPLFFYTVGINLFNAFDMLFVKAVGGIPQAAGFYGAAKNLTIVPALFATSFSPLLLAKLAYLKAEDNGDAAQIMTRHTMRLVLCLLPFAGMAAGAAPEVVTAIYGGPFLPAATLLAFLIFAALGLAMITVTTSTLIAAGRPGLPVMLTGPFVAVAPLAHFVLVPRFGPIGAAATTTGLAWLGAGACMLAVCRIWHVAPSAATLLRSLVVCAMAYTLAVLWPSPGVLLLLKLPAIGLVIVIAFLLLGEFNTKEIAFTHSMFHHGRG
ncbi:MAG: polysaccharide biosynthesis protein [Deltaproteobacteria bacterium]|nr:polysaccharide biosynthesis protein [Deltaproteobacteria bacterium]